MTKTTILFIQGGGEGAYEADKKLVDRLKKDLGKRYKTLFPRMPAEKNPDYEKYKIKIEKELNKINGELILVGHSLGACFLLKYISEGKIEKDISGIFLLSTPFWGPGGWEFEGFSMNNELAAKKISNKTVFFYHGTQDEIVPFSHITLYEATFSHAKFRKIAGQGHQFDDDLSDVVKDITTLHHHY
jgi:predicted alpha/beta hydrolase family esterase